MAAKLLHSLADDNPDLQKQIGCMTGIFQIFDRQHFVSGRRPNQRRLLPPPSGISKVSNGHLEADSGNAYTREAVVKDFYKEKNPSKYSNEKQRASTESSRASFSSSRSSSYSSLDCGRVGQPESSSMDRMIFPETPSRDPVISQTNASPKMGRLSVDLRDVVKDAMYRDSRGLSMQTTNKEEESRSDKHKGSPRPLQLSKSMDESLGVGSNGHSVPDDIKESLRVLARLRDAQWSYNEKELPRLSYESKEGSSFPMAGDAPRFSYDGREINNRNIKNSRRLSLDSRESSARSTINDSNFMQPLFSQSRPSSVVAKLMGLDILPETKKPSESQLAPVKISIEGNGATSAPLRVPDVYRPVRLPKSPRSSRKEPTSPRRRTADAVMKPVSTSKFPIEPAPWKHQDNGRASPKQDSKQVKSSSSALSNSQSVYGEIEKRLKDIEFKQSGKDLRALKQILVGMQAKGILEATKVQQSPSFRNKQDNDQRVGSDVNFKMMDSSDSRPQRLTASKHRGNATSKACESPIVIMKPAKPVQKSGVSAASVISIDSLPGLHRPHNSEGSSYRNDSNSSRMSKNQTTRDSRRDQAVTSADKKSINRNSRVAQSTSKSPQPQVGRDYTTNSLKSSGSVSPRLQRKLEFERRSRPPTPPFDSSKTRRQSNRQFAESVSPGGRCRISKISDVRQVDDQASVKSNDLKNLSFQEDSAAMHSDTNLASETRIFMQDASTEKLEKMASFQSPSREPFNPCLSDEVNEDVRLILNEEDIVRDLAIGPEQPSPVSVLDSSVHMEDSPSPVKQISHALEGDVTSESTGSPREELWGSEDNLPASCTLLELPSEISRKKLQSIDNLVQKLRRLNSNHDESQTDYIALLCENTNPDHRYVSEILLASGLLLRELSSSLTAFQLHPSGHPINPELFFVLEQTKASSLLAQGDNTVDEIALLKSKPQKFHRKLIFDTVNELLVRKLALVGHSPEPWFKPEKLARKNLNSQKLLRELCADIELLEAKKQEFSLDEEDDGLKTILSEDVMLRSESWTNFGAEVSSIVLDVERSIFKDLVDEVIKGEAAGVQGKPSRRCRQQLFSK